MFTMPLSKPLPDPGCVAVELTLGRLHPGQASPWTGHRSISGHTPRQTNTHAHMHTDRPPMDLSGRPKEAILSRRTRRGTHAATGRERANSTQKCRIEPVRGRCSPHTPSCSRSPRFSTKISDLVIQYSLVTTALTACIR